MSDKTVLIDPEMYAYVAEQAKKNKRTIKGQIEYMLEIGRESTERVDRIRAGETETQYSGPITDEIAEDAR